VRECVRNTMVRAGVMPRHIRYARHARGAAPTGECPCRCNAYAALRVITHGASPCMLYAQRAEILPRLMIAIADDIVFRRPLPPQTSAILARLPWRGSMPATAISLILRDNIAIMRGARVAVYSADTGDMPFTRPRCRRF